MRREFKVEANVGKPQVAYRETIRTTVKDIEGKHAKQSGGRGQYGHVVIDMYPLEEGKAYEFVNDIKGGVILVNSSRVLIKVSVSSSNLVRWLVTRLWIWVCVCTSVLTTMSTLPNWRSKSLLPWPLRLAS